MHTTRNQYGSPVRYGLQEPRLTPQSGPAQEVLGWEFDIQGGAPRLFMVHSEGNPIEASDDVPFPRIGGTKCGRPILVHALTFRGDRAGRAGESPLANRALSK